MPWTFQTIDDNVVLVRMNTSAMNTHSLSFIADLNAATATVEREHPRAVVLLASEGRCFSAGLDFDAVFGLFASQDVERVRDFCRTYITAILRWFALPNPTVSIMEGHAFAGGAVLALASDFRVARPTVRFALNEVPIGIPMPAPYVEILAYAVGRPVAVRTMLLGEEFTGQTLAQLGIAHVLATEDLVGAARRLVATLDRDSAVPYALTKRALQSAAMSHAEAILEDTCRELPRVLVSPETLRLLARRYEAIKGTAPKWRPG